MLSCYISLMYAALHVAQLASATGDLDIVEPYCFRPDGTEYNDGSRYLNIKAIEKGSFAVAFFGSKYAGKSRLIEEVSKMEANHPKTDEEGPKTEPLSISSPLFYDSHLFYTKTTEIYDNFKDQNGHTLYCIDTPGFGIGSGAGRNSVLRGIDRVRTLLEKQHVPLKRIYFVVDANVRSGSAYVKNLQLLRKTLGVDVARQIRFILNKSEVRRFGGQEDFDVATSCLIGFYKKVFPEYEPARPLIVSAARGFGQLLEDLAVANQDQTLDLNNESSQSFSTLIQDLDQDLDRRDTIKQRLGSIVVNQNKILELDQRSSQLEKELHEIEKDLADARSQWRPELDCIWPSSDDDIIFNQVASFDEKNKLDHLKLFKRYNFNQDPAHNFCNTKSTWQKLQKDREERSRLSTTIDNGAVNKERKAEEISTLRQKISDMESLLAIDGKLAKFRTLAG